MAYAKDCLVHGVCFTLFTPSCRKESSNNNVSILPFILLARKTLQCRTRVCYLSLHFSSSPCLPLLAPFPDPFLRLVPRSHSPCNCSTHARPPSALAVSRAFAEAMGGLCAGSEHVSLDDVGAGARRICQVWLLTESGAPNYGICGLAPIARRSVKKGMRGASLHVLIACMAGHESRLS